MTQLCKSETATSLREDLPALGRDLKLFQVISSVKAYLTVGKQASRCSICRKTALLRQLEPELDTIRKNGLLKPATDALASLIWR